MSEPAGSGGLGGSAEAAQRTVAPLIEPVAELAAATGFDRRQLRTVLPHVLVDVPVALLLVDRRDRSVVYANDAAVALAGVVGLPTALEGWGRASELTDVGGDDLSADASVLVRVLDAAPHGGEAVRARAGGGLGELLWVTGIPLSAGAASAHVGEAQDGDDSDLALLLFLRVGAPPGAAVDPDSVLAALRSRAVVATDLAFSISDPNQPDNPLQWANPAFGRMTGYTTEEVIGRNCRFLQGPDTDPEPVAAIRSALAERRATTQVLLNYRKDGTPFWNQLSVSPVLGVAGELLSFVGVQYDVSERVRSDTERAAALDAERAARLEREAGQRRLALMAEVTTELAATLDLALGLERLAELVVPAIADWVAINLYTDDPSDSRPVLRHRDGMEAELSHYGELQAAALLDSPIMDKVRSGGEATLLEEVDLLALRHRVGDELAGVIERLGMTSAVYVPLVARQHRVLGSMMLLASTPDRRFGPEELSMAIDIGLRAGVNLDNARLYEQEHRVAEILQRSLLPALPRIDGVATSASYLPANSANDIGGDFYEVLALPDGAVGFAVGDVIGHDMSAAAAMGHLRGLLRACAWDLVDGVSPPPSSVIGRVDRLVQGLEVVPLATAVYLRAARTDQGWRLSWSNAGHPPPLLRHPGGSVESLSAGAGVLLGVDAELPRGDGVLDVQAGTTILLFTDGLVERRNESMDLGLARVAELLAAADDTDLDGLVASVLTDLHGNHDDDVAVVAVKLG